VRSILRGLCLLILLLPGLGYGHENPLPGDPETAAIGVEEKMGELLPLGLIFHDENGTDVRLGSLLGKPTILALVYYTCEHICPLMLSGLAQAVPRLAVTAGKEYRIIAVSFDETDTPEIARNVKRNYIKAAGLPSAEMGWTFLTGGKESIQHLTESVGFRFQRDIHGFNHPTVLIFLTPSGKVSKYLPVTNYRYGTESPITFSSFDLNIALTEAAEGKTVTGFRKAFLYCFSHEPPGQSRFFNFIAWVGLATLLAFVALFIYLLISSRRYRRLRGYNDGE
jgi:protein SCO1